MLFVFVLSFVLFCSLQFSIDYPPEPDGFYHIKYSSMLRNRGLIISAPWLIFWKEKFADTHFLYHILLVPFTFFDDTIFGLKLATALFASLVPTTFYWLLSKNRVKHAFYWTTILLGASGLFMFRLTLPRAMPLSIVFLLVSIQLLAERKHVSLSALSFLYVWLYPAFPTMLLLVFIYCLWSYMKTRNIRGYEPVLYCLTGLLLGILINPYFPQNIHAYETQILMIGLNNPILAQDSEFGSEWRPLPLWLFTLSNIGGFLCMLLMIHDLIKKRSHDTPTLTAFSFSIIFLALSLKSQRYAEYWIPTAVLSCALSFKTEESLRQTKKFLAVLLMAALLYYSISTTLEDLTYRPDIRKHRDCGIWLKENTHDNALVLAEWDDFPPLFYYNGGNTYVAGLDPAFTRDYDEGLYRGYVDFFRNYDISYDFMKEHDISYIFLSKYKSQHSIIRNKLVLDGGFNQEYASESCVIFAKI